ncbi:MAG: GNAT family N-acetyltransferase [Lewinella sp.]
MPLSSTFCCPPSTLPRKGWPELPGLPGWRIRDYRQATDWSNWPGPKPADSFWLSADFLSFTQQNAQGLQSEAVALCHPDYDRPVLLSVQSLRLRLKDQIRRTEPSDTGLARRWRQLLSSLPVDVLILGQLLTSGPFGGSGLEQLSPPDVADLLAAVGRFLMQDRRSGGLVIKDLLPRGHAVNGLLTERGFSSVAVDPVMMLDLDPFQEFGDYMAALSSKYRVRYRRARRKGEGLERRPLTGEQLKSSLALIYDLHRETRQGADFSFVELSVDYFDWLRGRADYRGYFDGDTLVGFTTAIISGDYFHAHYLGLKEPYKHSHHLYHNMLFDLLEDAISQPVRILDYGRTALEIKSSLGAEAQPYNVLAVTRYSWLNPVLRRVLSFVHTPEDWVARNPIK